MATHTPPTEHRRAARAIALEGASRHRAGDACDHCLNARQLLDMLGLLGTDGHSLLEPPEGVKRTGTSMAPINGEIKSKHYGLAAESDRTPMSKRSSLPPGLRNIPEDKS